MSALAIRRFLQKVVTGTTQPLTLGGIADDGSDAKLTIATDGSISTSTPVTVPSLVVNSKNVASNLLAEYTVTGSAVTSIDFSGLDINTHKSYRVELGLTNATSSPSRVEMYVNGDTTSTNYYTQLINANNATLASGKLNLPLCCYLAESSSSMANVNISTVGSVPKYSFNYSENSPSAMLVVCGVVSKTSTVANITQLTFTSMVANAIGVGSTIRLYRGDV